MSAGVGVSGCATKVKRFKNYFIVIVARFTQVPEIVCDIEGIVTMSLL